MAHNLITQGIRVYVDGVELADVLKFDLTSSQHVAVPIDISCFAVTDNYREVMMTSRQQYTIELLCISHFRDPGQLLMRGSFGQVFNLKLHVPSGQITSVPVYVKECRMHSEPSAIETTRFTLLQAGEMVTYDPCEPLEGYDLPHAF